MNKITLPPVNRGADPLLCEHGAYAVFQGPDGEIELSLLCELTVGHTGSHFAEGAGFWADES